MQLMHDRLHAGTARCPCALAYGRRAPLSRVEIRVSCAAAAADACRMHVNDSFAESGSIEYNMVWVRCLPLELAAYDHGTLDVDHVYQYMQMFMIV